MEDRNKYKLKLPELGVRQNDEENNDLIVNILPSYHMYQSTISKNLTPTTDERSEPPMYELTPTASAASNLEYFPGISLPTSPAAEQEAANPFDSNGNVTSWDDTILANAHKLKRLTSINKELSKKLNIQIFLTEQIGRVGHKPTIIDPLLIELGQGDYLYGYILVTNNTSHKIPFDMFSVVLEGSATFGNTNNTLAQPPSRIVRLLTMFDFNASWNDACLDRLSTDHNDPHIPVNEIDPVDHTHVNFKNDKILEPGITYKKFFTFKLPEKLLESTCEHGLVKHLQLPPTLGISKNEVITTLRQKWKEGGDNESNTPKIEDSKDRHKRYASYTNDLAFFDLAVDYSISARIVGKASDYEHLLGKVPFPHTHDDEYVVANEDYCYLRFIAKTNEIFELNRKLINEEAKLMYANLVSNINDKIEKGRELTSREPHELLGSPTPSLHPTASHVELAKMQQKYFADVRASHRVNTDSIYEVLFPYKKKSVFGSSKVIGLAAFSTPKAEYSVPYVPLPKFQKPGQVLPSTRIKIPMDITFIFSDKNSVILPDFKKVSVELVALTIKSKALPIPVMFHPEMLFENRNKGLDNFDLVTIKKFQKYAMELTKLLKELGPEALEIDKDLIHDVKCLANLATKYDHLKIQNSTVQPASSDTAYSLLSQIPWELETITSTSATGVSEDQIRYFKKFFLNVDIKDATLNHTTSPEFCLVPNFQSCLLARLYYLKINLKCPNGEKLPLRVPILLQRRHE